MGIQIIIKKILKEIIVNCRYFYKNHLKYYILYCCNRGIYNSKEKKSKPERIIQDIWKSDSSLPDLEKTSDDYYKPKMSKKWRALIGILTFIAIFALILLFDSIFNII